MAHEDFVRFLELVNGDAGLRGRVAAIDADSQPEALRQLVAIGAEHDCCFGERDIDELFLATAVQEARDEGAELSLEALDSVAGGTATEQLFQATQSMQEMQMSFNLQYLSLQNKISHENRQFTMVSNIMKNKHDTAKNSINNIR